MNKIDPVYNQRYIGFVEEFNNIAGEDKRGIDKKLAFIKNLDDEERILMQKVCDYVSGKTLTPPTETETLPFQKALKQKVGKEAPITSTLTKTKKGFANLFGRISSKKLMQSNKAAHLMQIGLIEKDLSSAEIL